MASIIYVDKEGYAGNKMAALPEIDREGRRISYQAYFVIADKGSNKVLKYGTAQAVLTATINPYGYNVEIIGEKVDDVKILLHKVREIVGYTEENIFPYGITLENTTFLQRILWLIFGKTPKAA